MRSGERTKAGPAEVAAGHAAHATKHTAHPARHAAHATACAAERHAATAAALQCNQQTESFISCCLRLRQACCSTTPMETESSKHRQLSFCSDLVISYKR